MSSKLKQAFKKPIDQKDLKRVIYQTFFIAIVMGLLVGSIRTLIYFQTKYDFTWLLLFVSLYYISKRIKEAHFQSHILYQILAIFSFILTFYLSGVITNIGFYYVVSGNIPSYIVDFLNPITYFQFLNPFITSFYKINNIIDVVFFLICNYYVFKRSE